MASEQLYNSHYRMFVEIFKAINAVLMNFVP